MRSMTGCGRGQASQGGWLVTVELKSVNHRFLDIACRLPRNLAFLEGPLRQGLSAWLRRGHVEVFLTVQSAQGGSTEALADEALAASYLQAAEALSRRTGVPAELSMAQLLQLPGVVQLAEAALDEEAVQAACAQALQDALAALCALRVEEGRRLRDDLLLHLDAAEALRQKLLERAPQVVAEYRSRLSERLAALPIEPVDPARLAQEVALMADKCAVDEELSRLSSHITQLRAWLCADAEGEAGVAGDIGKRMDFLIQEMNREANTTGSKCADAQMAQWVVDLKSEIEKLREQVQNVE